MKIGSPLYNTRCTIETLTDIQVRLMIFSEVLGLGFTRATDSVRHKFRVKMSSRIERDSPDFGLARAVGER